MSAALAFVLTGVAPLAGASPIIYTYTGNAFTTFSNFSCNGTGICGIQGSLNLAGPLAANQYYGAVSPISYSFTDGQDTFNPSNSTVFDFNFATNASGDIHGWQIGLQNNFDLSYFYSEFGPAYVVGQDEAYDQWPTQGNAFTNSPGTWNSTQTQVTPEPATWALMGTGTLVLLGLGLYSDRRRRGLLS